MRSQTLQIVQPHPFLLPMYRFAPSRRWIRNWIIATLWENRVNQTVKPFTPAARLQCSTILHPAPPGKRACPPDRTNTLRCPDRLPYEQVCVNPRSLDAVILLSGFMRSRPIAFDVPPQSGEREGESWGRFGRGVPKISSSTLIRQLTVFRASYPAANMASASLFSTPATMSLAILCSS